MRRDAVEIAGAPRSGRILLTCEHGSNRLPAPFRATLADRVLLASHWGWDPGAARLTHFLQAHTGGAAILARFSRLLIDPNRHPTDPTAIVRACDDGVPSFNAEPNLADRVRRFHGPFHGAVHDALGRAPASLLLSIHTFTPVFRGERRRVEVGVLFDQHDALAERLAGEIAATGLVTALNEPYSGKDGLIYAAARHGRAHRVPYLELEVRHDLTAGRRGAHRIGAKILTALGRMGLLGRR